MSTLIPKEKLRTTQGKNVMRTGSLFFEVRFDDTHAVFTMSDNPNYINFRDLYLSYCVEDPTEYTFAKAVFGSWDHWMRIVNSQKLLRDFIESCREERDVAIKSKAIQEAVKSMEEGNFQASKWLAQKGYLKEDSEAPKRGRGRPKKEKEDTSPKNSVLQDDFKRIQVLN